MGRSLRLRLVLAAIFSIALALAVAGVGLALIFERHVVRRVGVELDAHLRQLADEIAFAADGTLQLSRDPSDPRFNDPLSGLYWQALDEGNGQRLRSRSLWDQSLVLPPRRADLGVVERHVIPGLSQYNLLVAERTVAYTDKAANRIVRLAIAVDRRDIVRARTAFASDAAKLLGLLALVLMAAAWTQIVVGLRPLEAVRRSVNRVRSGDQPRIAVDRPTEVMALVGEVNSLLDAQDAAIEQARRRAADLAHGLKTPLQVLAMDAERLRAKGEAQMADEIDELAAGMRRHVGRELSRARLQSWASTIALRTPVAESVNQIVRTLARSPKGQTMNFEIDVAADATAAIPSADLTEMIGSLLENAVKWAKSEVRVQAFNAPGSASVPGLTLVIEDDGPGVSPELLASLGKRGVRLDETVEGTGLGLAIAIDIVDAYGAQIAFGNREPTGFRVTITQARRG